MTVPKTLLTGWFSFRHGEATAGDVAALRHVQQELDAAGLPYDTAWSPGFHRHALHLARAAPKRYGNLVFVCGPLHGPQIAALHRRYAHCLRVAVGVSVLDPHDPAVRGFHRVLPRDAPGVEPSPDLAAGAPSTGRRPVVGVVLTQGQREYGPRRSHPQVARTITDWLATKDCARLPLETRLDSADWRLCATPEQLEAVLARLDLLVTNRLHGLVLALRAGVPVVAVDPVRGGAKVTEQARACDWPACVPAASVSWQELERWWQWCLTTGRDLARRRGAQLREGEWARRGLAGLVAVLRGEEGNGEGHGEGDGGG